MLFTDAEIILRSNLEEFMSLVNNMKLKALVESAGGLHISLYINKSASLRERKDRIKQSIQAAKVYLRPILENKDIAKMVRPLENVMQDEQMLSSFTGGIAIFRAQNLFRLINIPVEVESLCVVATTFHIKPLLTWMQEDKDFLLVGVEGHNIHLYKGSMTHLHKVTSFKIPRKYELGTDEYVLEGINWLDELLLDMPGKNRPRLYFAGNSIILKGLIAQMNFSARDKTIVCNRFSAGDPASIASHIRNIMKTEANALLKQSLQEY